MSKNNNETELKKLLLISNKCEELELVTLRYYCECMLKLWRIFYKIKGTEMLSYIWQIMSPVFPLMIRYFTNRADAYIDESKTEKEKVEILEDIERSVVEFWEVQEAIIQSSNGADRILFQSAPLDTGAHYAAPKLCAYYSEVLNSFAGFFDENEDSLEKNYAFCVYPTLNSQAEATMLFTTMEQKGKVVIIRVPGNDIANNIYILSLLLHEFFHIVPEKLRLRKMRANIFLNILLYDIGSLVIENIEIKEEEDKEKLRNYIFSKLIEDASKELTCYSEECRFFYSRQIMESFANKFFNYLRKVKSQPMLCMLKEIYPPKYPEDEESFSEYREKRTVIKQWHSQVNTNISNICESSIIQKKCNFYMGVFREAYADLLCVISLGLNPEQYFLTFRYSQKDFDESCVGIGLFLRVFFVKEVMSEEMNTPVPVWRSQVFNSWEKWSQHIEAKGKQKDNNGLIEGMLQVTRLYKNRGISYNQLGSRREDNDNLQWGGDNMEVVPNRVILERYLMYFRKCRDEYLKYLKKHEVRFKSFQERFMLNRQDINDKMNEYISFREWEIEGH